MKNISRRQLLTTTALGMAAVVTGAAATTSQASTDHHMMSAHSADCAHNHHALGHELSTLIADPHVDDTTKNFAIKTSSCPSCGTGIAPTGLGLAVHSWV